MILTTMVPIAMELRHLWAPGIPGLQAQRPSFMITHSIPGRLRLRLPELRGDEAFARQVKQALAPVPGVTQVTANPVTASVLVQFDPKRLDEPKILAELEGWGLISRAMPPPAAPRATRDGAGCAGRMDLAKTALLEAGKELAKAALAEAVGEAWFAPLLAFL